MPMRHPYPARSAKLRLAQRELGHQNSDIALTAKPNDAKFRAKWERNFSLLSVYRAREGHADVPHSHEEEEGVKLGFWLNSQRTAFKAGKLDQARQERLKSLGVEWDPIEAQWGQIFGLLSAYHAREGHAGVPKQHEEQGVKLGAWLATQRMVFKAGKLDQARQDRLKSLGMEWNTFEATWERYFGLLSAYRAREGHADVPRLHEEEGLKLGIWLDSQRQTFKAGKLDQARQDRLQSIDVTWDRLETQWERNFGLLSAYRAREGNADVPRLHEEEEVKLGSWLITQLVAFKAGKLGQARQERLKSIGVLWMD